MCGIAGILGLGNRLIDCKLAKSMCDALQHRGPDDEGYLAVNTKNNQLSRLVGPDSKVQGMRIAPNESQAFNPSFDITEGKLISGIISEFGIAKGDYQKTLKGISI